jgi:hypothetical protein
MDRKEPESSELLISNLQALFSTVLIPFGQGISYELESYHLNPCAQDV